MRFCQDHWDRLRAIVEAREVEGRSLSEYVAQDGKRAAAGMADEIRTEKKTLANFDPLMGAHWAIASNVMSTLERGAENPQAGAQLALYLMADAEEAPVTGYGAEYEGRTWPRCPLCYLNLGHEVTCTDPRCTLPKAGGYDFWLELAVDDQAETLTKLLAEERTA